MTSDIQLTEEQDKAVRLIDDWHHFHSRTRREYKLGGYAGTGKTTVIKFIKQLFERNNDLVYISAFTGKACNVLQRKGLYSAQTLHSLMYNVEVLPGGAIDFHKKDKLEGRPNLIIVDEASMLSTDLYEDLMSFNVPVLFVGDPGQLEPVGDNPNLMKEPDFVLQTIHRQAEDSPIIAFANKIRLGAALSAPQTSLKYGDGLTVSPKSNFKIPDLEAFDQVICAKNATRREINRKYRLFQQRPTDIIEPDDKLIILRNNRDCLVFNGMIVYVVAIEANNRDHWIVTIKDETDKEYRSVPLWKVPFQTELPKEYMVPKLYRKGGNDNGIPFIVADFGYAITCHKSQGSEWEKVLVWDEWMPPKIWDMKRWRYTAITRASKQLTYCL